MRLLIALLTTLTFVVACGGGDSSTPTVTSATATPAPGTAVGSTPAPVPFQTADPSQQRPVVACMPEHLVGQELAGGAAAGTFYARFAVMNTTGPCKLTGPPAISFLDSSNTGRAVPVTVGYGTPCDANQVDPSLCIEEQPITLSSALDQVIVTVAITNVANYDPLPTPNYQAQSIAFKFPGQSGLVIPLSETTTLISSGQVHLQGYGRSQTP